MYHIPLSLLFGGDTNWFHSQSSRWLLATGGLSVASLNTNLKHQPNCRPAQYFNHVGTGPEAYKRAYAISTCNQLTADI